MTDSFWSKIVAFFMSIIMAIGAFFGINEPAQEDKTEYFNVDIKNIIYLIGDGMGFNHLEKTKLERQTTLVMDSFEFAGSSMTRSANSEVTDSAAGGTALSSGVRTDNGAIGVYPSDKDAEYSYPKNITELCMEKGMLTGVVTTDETTGATPSAFSAHSSSRNNAEELTVDQFASGINLIWGKANGIATESVAEANGYEYIATYDEMMALSEGSYSYGQFTSSLWTLKQSHKKTPNLEQMAMKAIDILDDTDEGFFLMIEGAHIDKHSHNNISDKMTESLKEFDNTIEAVLEYAKADGETLVIVTADHETGGISIGNGSYNLNLQALKSQKMSEGEFTLPINGLRAKYKNQVPWEAIQQALKENFGFWDSVKLNEKQEARLKAIYDKSFGNQPVDLEKTLYSQSEPIASEAKRILNSIANVGWVSGGHSAGYVPVYAIGANAELFQGRMDNTEIPVKIAEAAGYQH